jgi:diguanylate cyclase (GGDEF)-like protein
MLRIGPSHRQLSGPAAAQAAAVAARAGLAPHELTPAVAAVIEALLDDNEDLRRRLKESEAQADRDALTGLLNRRAFMRALHRALSFVERYQAHAAVVYIDLDGFKAINDGYGHAVGDVVLRHVARLLLQNVRDSDVVGRLGGDEFGVILSRSTEAEAAQKAEALTQTLAAQPCIHLGVAHAVRASIGVRPLAPAEDPEAAIARADEAMYARKHARKLHAAE